MKRKLLPVFSAIALLIGLGLAGFAPANAASGNHQTATQSSTVHHRTFQSGTQSDDSPPSVSMDIQVHAAGDSTLQVSSVTKLNYDARGRIMLGPVSHPVDKGALHWKYKDAQKCPTVANQPRTQKALKRIHKTTFVKKGAALKRFRKAVPSAKTVKRLHHGNVKLSVRCYWVRVGGGYTDTGQAPDGTLHGYANHVGAGSQPNVKMLFDTFRDTVRDNGHTVTQEVSRRRGQHTHGTTVSVGDCLNEKAKHVEFHPGQFVYFNSWSKLRMHVQGSAHQVLHVAGSGTISQGTCSTTVYYDFQTTAALAFDQIILARNVAEAKGKAASIVSSWDLSSSAKGSIQQSLTAEIKASFTGCSTTPPPPPPGQHWVHIGCTGFEELSGDELMIIKCNVSTDDQSADVSLDAHSNDGNSRVSGINCFSQDGAPSCHGDGTFEFGVSGNNDGTSVVYSSVTAVASANDASATFTSDPFPVDPKDGGFFTVRR